MKGIEERGRWKEERGKRKVERGKRKVERGKWKVPPSLAPAVVPDALASVPHQAVGKGLRAREDKHAALPTLTKRTPIIPKTNTCRHTGTPFSTKRAAQNNSHAGFLFFQKAASAGKKAARFFSKPAHFFSKPAHFFSKPAHFFSKAARFFSKTTCFAPSPIPPSRCRKCSVFVLARA